MMIVSSEMQEIKTRITDLKNNMLLEFTDTIISSEWSKDRGSLGTEMVDYKKEKIK